MTRDRHVKRLQDRLGRAITGSTPHRPRAVIAALAHRFDVPAPNDPVPPRDKREVAASSPRPSRRTVTPGPHAPQLIRLNKNPQPLEVVRGRRAAYREKTGERETLQARPRTSEALESAKPTVMGNPLKSIPRATLGWTPWGDDDT